MAIREEVREDRFVRQPQAHESEFDDTVDHDDDEHDDDHEESPQLNDDGSGGDDGHAAESGGEAADESASDETDEEREAIRARRREERRQKKELQRQREDRLRADLAARDQIINNLSTRLQAIESRGINSELVAVDNELNQLTNVYVSLKQQLEKGTENQDGRAVADATEKIFQVRQRAEQLQRHKMMVVQNAQRAAAAAQQAPDPRLVNHASRWMSEHKWYKTDSADRDSRTVTALDNALTAEGWDASTPEYWEELSARVAAALPHRANGRSSPSAGSPPPAPRNNGGSPVGGSSRSAAGAGRPGSKEYTLSPERVSAMKELGIWDDPKRRADMIAEYKRYDKENGVTR